MGLPFVMTSGGFKSGNKGKGRCAVLAICDVHLLVEKKCTSTSSCICGMKT